MIILSPQEKAAFRTGYNLGAAHAQAGQEFSKESFENGQQIGYLLGYYNTAQGGTLGEYEDCLETYLQFKQEVAANPEYAEWAFTQSFRQGQHDATVNTELDKYLKELGETPAINWN